MYCVLNIMLAPPQNHNRDIQKSQPAALQEDYQRLTLDSFMNRSR